MTTLLQTNGTWNTTPTTIGRGVWQVTVFDNDPAGNIGSDHQALTISTASGGTGTTGPGGTTSPTGSTRLKASLSATSYRAGRGKRVRISFVLNTAAKVVVTLVRGKKTIATLGIAHDSGGRRSITWNGRIRHGLAAKGTYKIELRAVASSGATSSDAAVIHIT
jgi:hypothetical protein